MAPQKQIALLIHNDAADIDLMRSTIANIYQVVTARSIEEAEKVLPTISPVICICNLSFVFNGDFYIKTLVKRLPESIHLIITNFENTKDIVVAIQTTKAFMYLNKPLNALNIFQAIVVCTDKYRQMSYIKKNKNIIAQDVEAIKSQLNDAKQKEELLHEKINVINNAKEELIERIEDSKRAEAELSNQIMSIRSKNNELNTTIVSISQENENLAMANQNYQQTIVSLENFPNQLVSTLMELIEDNEQYYFTPHITAVREIAMVVANEMGLGADEVKNLIMAVMIHNVYEFPMPVLLKLSNPYNLEEKLKLRYFRMFNRTINKLKEVERLAPHIEIISQIWEHDDASGYPRQLGGKEISPQAQIIGLANMYHNMVYRLHPAQYKHFNTHRTLVQQVVETAHRHKETIKFLLRNKKWFDPDVLQTFNDVMTDKLCRQLVPKSSPLTLTYKAVDLELIENEANDKMVEIANVIGNTIDFEYTLPENEKEILKYEIRKVQALNIKEGMRTIMPIKTFNGIEVVAADTTIGAIEKNKIGQLFTQRIIEDEIELQVPILI